MDYQLLPFFLKLNFVDPFFPPYIFKNMDNAMSITITMTNMKIFVLYDVVGTFTYYCIICDHLHHIFISNFCNCIPND